MDLWIIGTSLILFRGEVTGEFKNSVYGKTTDFKHEFELKIGFFPCFLLFLFGSFLILTMSFTKWLLRDTN